jgi:hypothetical protein
MIVQHAYVYTSVLETVRGPERESVSARNDRHYTTRMYRYTFRRETWERLAVNHTGRTSMTPCTLLFCLVMHHVPPPFAIIS